MCGHLARSDGMGLLASLALLGCGLFRIHDGLSDAHHQVVARIRDRRRIIVMGSLNQPHPGVFDDPARGAQRIGVGIMGSRHQQTSSRSGGAGHGAAARLSSGRGEPIGRAM
jgi:hypothetical protein